MRVVLGKDKRVLVNQTGVNLQRLSDLNDVDTSNVKDGDLMIYNESTKTYVFGDQLSDLDVTDLTTKNLNVENLIANGNILLNGTVDLQGDVTFDNFTSTNGTVTDTLTTNDLVVQGILNSDNITSQTISVLGDLRVIGQLTSLLTEELEIADNIVVLNSNIPNSVSPSQDSGISIKRGNQPNVTLLWNETLDLWTVGSRNFQAQNFIGNLQGNATTATSLSSTIQVNLTDDVTGNTTFDGTGNITIQTTVEFVDGGYY